MKNSKIISMVISIILSIPVCFIISKITTVGTFVLILAFGIYYITIFNIIYPILNVKEKPFNKVKIYQILSSFFGFITYFSGLVGVYGIIQNLSNIMLIVCSFGFVLFLILSIIWQRSENKLKND